MDTLLIIDGNAIMHRAYHALPPFATKSGIPTNVIYGFFGMMHKAIEIFKPTHIAVCFDTSGPTFRQKLLKEYQAQRPSLPDDFRKQIPLLHELLEKAGIFQEGQQGLEADDIIGTIAEKTKAKKMRTFILTGDRDIMQLVNNHIYVISPKLGLSDVTMYDEDMVKGKLGVKPSEITDYKALVGDPSDNNPGARGIGPKTAIILLQKFKTVENLLKNIDKLPEGRQKELIKENVENIKISKKLAVIVTDAKIKFTFDQAKFNGFPESFREHLQGYEMKSLIERLFGQPKKVETRKTAEPKKKKTKENLKDQINLF